MADRISSKADVLKSLYGKLKYSRVEKLKIVTGAELDADPYGLAAEIAEEFAGGYIVVRSSSSNEDGLNTSNAGHYESILGVDPSDGEAVVRAVREVLDSYKCDLDDVSGEQVLIQRQITNISYSGVIFSREIKKDRPYYTITYDDSSTDAVTSGRGGKTVYIIRNVDCDELPANWAALIRSMRELEEMHPEYPLDVEFAIDEDNTVTIFQMRPLAASINGVHSDVDDEEVFRTVLEAEDTYREISSLVGDRNTILSDMAFWNPAEIIGENPHPLDYSLYREIITSAAWNQGLSYIGYREVDGDLMYKLGNKPYISLKKSFLGLMPDELDDRLEAKLLKYYDEKLIDDPTAHDKIEFEIAFSEYDFSTEDKLRTLTEAGFTREEIEDLSDSLFNLTNNAICNFNRNRMKDLRALNGLRVHRENTRSNWLMAHNDVVTLIQYFVQLIESIKHYGTPKFARQARLAFISKAISRSLVYRGYFTDKEIDDFMMSIYTVASEYDSDFQDLVEINRAALGGVEIVCEENELFSLSGDEEPGMLVMKQGILVSIQKGVRNLSIGESSQLTEIAPGAFARSEIDGLAILKNIALPDEMFSGIGSRDLTVTIGSGVQYIGSEFTGDYSTISFLVSSGSENWNSLASIGAVYLGYPTDSGMVYASAIIPGVNILGAGSMESGSGISMTLSGGYTLYDVDIDVTGGADVTNDATDITVSKNGSETIILTLSLRNRQSEDNVNIVFDANGGSIDGQSSYILTISRGLSIIDSERASCHSVHFAFHRKIL